MGKSLRWSRKAQSERFRHSPYFTIRTQWALSTTFREFVSAFRVLEESFELFGRKQRKQRQARINICSINHVLFVINIRSEKNGCRIYFRFTSKLLINFTNNCKEMARNFLVKHTPITVVLFTFILFFNSYFTMYAAVSDLNNHCKTLLKPA